MNIPDDEAPEYVIILRGAPERVELHFFGPDRDIPPKNIIELYTRVGETTCACFEWAM